MSGRALMTDALHALRLVTVEEKYYNRVAKRLLSKDAPINRPNIQKAIAPTQTKLSPEDGSDLVWREDALSDFAQFDANVFRAQLLLNSNSRERGRYGAEKLRIKATAASVREKNIALHARLADSQKTLRMRKAWDVLVENITNDKALKPRNEQRLAIAKLQMEISELKAESQDYARTWGERREQFGRIVDEGRQMLRLIRDEKEEAERKEGLEEVGEEAKPGVATNAAAIAAASGTSTPVHTSSSGDGGTQFQSGVNPHQRAPHTTESDTSAGEASDGDVRAINDGSSSGGHGAPKSISDPRDIEMDDA